MKTPLLILWITSLLLLLNGCGGGGGSSSGETVPVLSASSATIAENASPGERAGAVMISNTGDSPITSMSLTGTGSHNFAIDTNGNITLAAGAILDYETTPIYHLSATATNTNGTSLPAAVTITVSDYLNPFQIAKLTAEDPNQWASFGHAVAIDGDYIVIGVWGDDTYGTHAGSAYVYKKDRNNHVVQIAKLTASDAEAGSSFGSSVAINGEYIVIGAYHEDTHGNQAGCAYLFKRNSNDTLTQIDQFTSRDIEAGDEFGTSVSIHGNYIVIGAPKEDAAGINDAGSAYLFKYNPDGTVSQVAKLSASNISENAYFGYAVAVDGNYIVAGAFNGEASHTGSAYLFKRISDTDINQIAKLTADDAESGDRFGISVAIDGEYIVLGADGESQRGFMAGSAYLFKRFSDTEVTEIAKLTANDGQENNRFGISVAISGDYIIVGAEAESELGFMAGSAYLFMQTSSGNITQIKKLTAYDAHTDDTFGYTVAMSGDYCVIGADRKEVEGLYLAGSAYVFDLEPLDRPYIYNRFHHPVAYRENFLNRAVLTVMSDSPSENTIDLTVEGSDGAWFSIVDKKLYFDPKASYEAVNDENHDNIYEISIKAEDHAGTAVIDATVALTDSYLFELASLNAEDADSGHYFGHAVAVSGNYIVVGAFLHDKVYLFQKEENGTITHLSTFSGEDTESGDLFGISVAIDGNTIAIGATMEDTDQSNSGAVYLFKYYPDSPESLYQIAKIKASVPNSGDQFGQSVAIDGNYIAVGAPKDDTHATDAGSLYLFYLESGNNITQKAKVFSGDLHANDLFGYAVDIDYPYIVSGAYQNTSGAGSAYVFKIDTTGLTQIDRLIASDGDFNDHFGIAVSIFGQYIAIGANGDDDGISNSGSAYVFKLDSDATNDFTELAKLHAGNRHADDRFGSSVSISVIPLP